MAAPEQIARIRISLNYIEPEIWRLVEVPLSTHLWGLHDIIQAAMGWLNYHLFEFRDGSTRYGIPEGKWDREVRQAKSVKLAALVSSGVNRLDYVYDFGDEWEHTIRVEAVFDADPGMKYPRLVAGARRCPPEDVGGPPGFFDFIEAMANPKHSEYRHLVEWYGKPFDPDDIDLLCLSVDVDTIANRRHGGMLAYAKRRAKS